MRSVSTHHVHTYHSNQVIGDHTRSVAYLISDGVTPSNVGRGYIVRRLLRRVVMKVWTLSVNLPHHMGGPRSPSTPFRPHLQGRLLGVRELFTAKVAEVAVSLSGACDPQVRAVGAVQDRYVNAELSTAKQVLNDHTYA